LANVKLENVTKRFGPITAINKLNFEVRSGEFFVLLGPTGAGKTTTLRCVAGLEKQDEGDIYIDNVNVNSFDPAHRDVAFVFQYYSLYPHLTVRENLEFPLKPKHRKLPEDEINRRVVEVAKILHIDHLLDRRSDKLSGGEMQRVSIGRAIVRKPKVFLMDEPLSNLDAKLREELRSELKHLQIDLGATFFFVTHDQVEAMTMADRIAVLNKGRILQMGAPFDIYNHPANMFVASFVGSPAMNFFKAEIVKNEVLVPEDNIKFSIFKEHLSKLGNFQGNVVLGIRPEDISLSLERKEGFASGNIYNIENMGMEKIVSIKTKNYTFKVVTKADFEAPINEKVYFNFDMQKAHYFNLETRDNLITP